MSDWDDRDDLGLASLLRPSSTSPDGAARVRALGDARRRRNARLGAAAAIVAVLLVLVGVAVAMRAPGTTTVDTAGTTSTTGSSSPGTTAAGPVTTGPSDGASTTTAGGSPSTTAPELPTRTAPDGWQAIEYGDIRFAVPGSWRVEAPGGPACIGTGDVVLLEPSTSATSCPMQPAGVTPFVKIQTDDLPDATIPAKLGDLDVKQGPPIPRPCCINTIVQFEQWTISIEGGPDADASAIGDTFTWSSRYRALQPRPLLDTSGWQTVTEDGVTMKVPETWTKDERGPDDHRPNPGECGVPPFAPGTHLVVVGESVSGLLCPYRTPALEDLVLADGAWIHSIPGTAIDPSAADGRQAASGASILIKRSPYPVIMVQVPLRTTDATVSHGPGRGVEITLGVGVDPAVARTILSTIEPST